MQLILSTTFQSRFIRFRQHNEMVRSFFFERPPDFEFAPGQFVTLITENGVRRSYSIANRSSRELELCISLKSDGIVTPLLWQATSGNTFTFEGPLGSFTAPAPLRKELCLICTGTGIAPFRSLIHQLFNEEVEHQKVYLISGNRYLKDMLYHDELTELAATCDWFDYLPICSRETLNGQQGYVHSVYTRLFEDQREACFMVCGWEAMCKEARNTLKAMGYNRRQYFFEQYDG